MTPTQAAELTTLIDHATAAPFDASRRAVLADWLEEAGEEKAAWWVRWVNEMPRSTPSRSASGKMWIWEQIPKYDGLSMTAPWWLPPEIFVRLRGNARPIKRLDRFAKYYWSAESAMSALILAAVSFCEGE